jgi:ArsR family transcriptional regulator
MATIHDRMGHLSQPERTRLLRLLELEELAVGEIARVVQLPQSTVSRHLKALEEDGWVVARREGTARLFALSATLEGTAARLWEVVREAVDGDHPEDGLRLASVLAARTVGGHRFFGAVAERWSEVRRELFGPDTLLPALLGLLPAGLRVVDLGCGTGDALAALAPHVALAVGIDGEPAMLEQARRRLAASSHVTLVAGRLEAVPLPGGAFDAALLGLVLHHVDDPAVVLAEARRLLAPGGVVVVLDMVAHDREAFRRTMGHVSLGFSAEVLASLAADAGLVVRRRVVLPPDPTASGPALFLSVLGVAEA